MTSKPYPMRLPEGLKKKLEFIADEQDMALQEIILQSCRNAVQAWEKEHGKISGDEK